MNFTNILILMGGLGLFLLGMNQMSDGIEKAAGAKLRSILEMFTKNPFIGMIVGIVFTGIIQSSSACTAMVVSFVNSGLMNLYQAAGVIFGANIGTTITSQLVSLDLTQFAAIFLLIGVLITMFCKNNTIQKIGECIAGFGVLFMGISMMKEGMEALNSDGSITRILETLTNPILAILLGMTITAIVQSSSVTVSIILIMAQQGLFADVNICLYIILGCNIGACSTAIIKSLAGKKEAKRTAMIHLLFNVIGSLIMFIIFQVAMDPVSSWLHSISGDEGRFVANSHTIIKIFQVVVLFPFSKGIVKLTYLVVPGQDQKVGYHDTFQLKYIGDKVLFNPSTAVIDGIKELERMGSLASDNLNRAMNALITLDEEDINEVYEMEKNINFLNKSITKYLVKINQSTLPIEDLQGIGSLFHVANDIERISDHAENIADMALSRKNQEVDFSKEAQSEMTDMLNLVNRMIELAVKYMLSSDESILEEVSNLELKVMKMEKELQQHHVDRLTVQKCTPEAGMIFSNTVSALERVAEHSYNIVSYLKKSNNEEEQIASL